VNAFSRLSRTVLSVALLAASSCIATAQSSTIALRDQSSISGSFLAGSHALKDLDTHNAAEYLVVAAEANWDDPTLVERAFLALAADGQIERAADMAKHLLQIRPESELAFLTLGTVALKERRYASVLSMLEEVGSDTFIGITASVLRAWAAVGQGDLHQAYVNLAPVEGAGLEDFLVFHRALMADVAGERDTAIELAAAAYENDPFVTRIVEAYTRFLGNASRFTEAQDIILEYQAEGLSHPLIDEVRLSIDEGQRPGQFAANVSVGAAEMFHGIGTALASSGTNDVAVVFLRLGQYLSPSSDVLAVSLAGIFEQSGQFQEANAVYNSLPADSPLKDTALVNAASNLDRMGDRPEAIRRLRNFVAANPGNLDGVSVLGDLLRYDEQYAEAAEVYSRALELAGGDHPRDWRFYYVRGIAYERDGQWDSAESDFLRALELNPEQPQVLNYLGYSWVDMGLHLNEALDMIQRAVDASPRDGYIVDSLGWAFYRLDRFEDAVQALEQAVRLLPNDPEINDHLGDAYWHTGRYLEARFQWTIAADVDEVGNVAERVAPKLAYGLDAAAEISE
jgi:tetratricopeptide (TPR) repeat protein